MVPSPQPAGLLVFLGVSPLQVQSVFARRCHESAACFRGYVDRVWELQAMTETMELDGVSREVYWEVVDHCYLCDMCYMTKCPYVPPHEWNVDFPHLMLRAKAVKYKRGRVKSRDKLLTSTDRVGSLAGIPVVAGMVNRTNRKIGRAHV